jgi:hypothetical protein
MADISDYAGLNALIDIEVGYAGIPPQPAEAAVDHVNITPEPCTLGLIGVCMGAAYIRSQWAQGQGATS